MPIDDVVIIKGRRL